MVSIVPSNRGGPPGSLISPARDIVVIGASRGGVDALTGSGIPSISDEPEGCCEGIVLA